MKNFKKIFVVVMFAGISLATEATKNLASVSSSASIAISPSSTSQVVAPAAKGLLATLKGKISNALSAVSERATSSYEYATCKSGKALTWVSDHKIATAATVVTIAAVIATYYLVKAYEKSKADAKVNYFRGACQDFVNFQMDPDMDAQLVIDSTHLIIAKNLASAAEPFAKDEATVQAINVIAQAGDLSQGTLAQVDEAATFLVKNVVPVVA